MSFLPQTLSSHFCTLLLWLPCVFSPFLRLCLPPQISLLFKQRSSVLQHSLFGNIPRSFLCHGTSNFKFLRQPPGNSSFFSLDVPPVRASVWHSSSFELEDGFQHFLCASVSTLSGLLRFSSFAARRHRAQPEHFPRQTKASPFGSTLLTMRFLTLQSGPSHSAGTFVFSLLFRISCNGLCLQPHTPPTFVHKGPRFSSPHSCHSSTKQ